MNDPKLLASIGMGTLVLNMISFGPYLGINSGIETLVPQAFGAGNLRKCGVYLQRGRFIAICAFVPMLITFLFSYKALVALGQDVTVCKYSFHYILMMIPSMFMIGLADIQRKFLI